MPLILSIDTATINAGLYLAENENILAFEQNSRQQDHAAWIHNGIRAILEKAGKTISELNAVAVIAGPGSYTGLRVGMATAKGICYALNLPLITESSLKVLAASCLEMNSIFSANNKQEYLYAPMIDARRMEVFTAVYDSLLNEELIPQPMILEETSYADFLNEKPVCFFGNGADKWKSVCKNPQAKFVDVTITANCFAKISYEKFLRNEFTTLAYAEPVYLKEFYTHHKL